MIEELKKNVETEIHMLREIAMYAGRVEYASEGERGLLEGVINSLRESMKILNSSIPQILKESAPGKKLPSLPDLPKKRKSVGFENIQYRGLDTRFDVVLTSKDKERFLRELSISEAFLKKLKKRRKEKKAKYEEFRGARGYLKFANKLFLKQSSSLIKSGYFRQLSVELRKANLNILFESYVAMILFSVLLSVVFSVFLTVFLLFFSFAAAWPFIGFYEGALLSRFFKVFWIPVVVPLLTFGLLYIYPSAEKKSIRSKVDQELPFAVVHMSAISGSGIAPVEIFKIIGLSREYPNLRREIRKILNQINLYGYDLVTALNNSSKTSPSEKLADLYAGLSATITSGADLSGFFDKRSESLLFNYRNERTKYTKLVETFLDVYISVVITAPLIFLLLIVMMSISGIDVGFTTTQISLLAVIGVALLNVVFLVFLQIRQPAY